MESDYDAFSYSQASPKRGGKIANIAIGKPKALYSISSDNEYFPIPFEASKRLSVESSKVLRDKSRTKSDA